MADHRKRKSLIKRAFGWQTRKFLLAAMAVTVGMVVAATTQCLPRPAIQGTVAVTILPALRGQHTIKAGVEVMAQAMAVTLAGKVNAVHGTAHCCNGISKVNYV